MNYYNEFDPKAAAWLRNLIAAGLIPAGDVDERSIEDVIPNELRGYTQCHFFAGIGGWPLALALAGWPSSRSVWTGSCPCQPFSAAGKGAGFADERHLWPAWQHLIAQCRPPVIFGEQVASKAVGPWIDLVQADLEGMGYAFGCVPFPAAGIGAPHIRDRTFWVADADSGQRDGLAVLYRNERNRTNAGRAQGFGGAAACGNSRGLADADGRNASAERQQRVGEQRQQPQDGGVVRLADATTGGWREECADAGRCAVGDSPQRVAAGFEHGSGDLRPGPTNGQWGAADWLACTDGKWRPVSASPQPLVDGLPIGLGLVRADQLQEIEGEVNAWEMETGFGRSEALRDLWRSAHEAAPRVWSIGRIPGLHEAPFLLAFMRQLARQGWGIAECIPVSGEEVSEGRMRVLWSDVGIASASCELQLERQHAIEYPDALRVLSSILARHAHTAWSAAHSIYAESCFPLGKGLHGRVGRLRAYGNAIVPAQAAEFICAYAEARGLIL